MFKYTANSIFVQTKKMAKNILIVDDEFEVCKLIESILKKQGYKSRVAMNGAQALDFIEAGEKFDLITLDIMMPTLSGYDLLRLLREKVSHKSKVVYVTIIPKQEVDMSNIDGFVQKPFDTETFISEIKRVLKAK